MTVGVNYIATAADYFTQVLSLNVTIILLPITNIGVSMYVIENFRLHQLTIIPWILDF